MKAPRFIAGRLCFGGNMAMVSIAISFFIIIIAVAVSSGFRTEIRNGISYISGDIRITRPDMNFAGTAEPLSMNSYALEGIDSIEGVAEVIPAAYRAGIVKNDDKICGVVFKGTKAGGDCLKVSIPSRLADILDLEVGDPILAYFVGDKIKARKFRIQSIYTSILSGDDNLLIFCGLSDIQRINGWSENEISAEEIILEGKYKNEAMIKSKTDEIGTRILIRTAKDESAPVASSSINRFPQLFSWLDLIDTNVLFILVLMTLVAGFNMISGLLILLFRNISTIGILKSMGMTDRHISEVFIRVSFVLVLKGMLIGNALAFIFCSVQGFAHIIKLNPDNYFLSYVPIHINPLLIAAADLVSFLIIMLLLLIPSLFVLKVDPAKTVRAQ